jgi:Mrp family chromosome partitioning ATPase
VNRHGLHRYYQILREQIWVVVGCTLVCLIVAGAYVALAPKRYSAQAQLLVSPASASDTTLFSLPVLHSSSDPTADVLTASLLVTTPQVANASVNALHLHESGGVLLGTVTATPVGQSNLVAVQANASTPQQAQAVANAFARQVIVTRTNALHKAIDAVLPGLRAQQAALSPSQRIASAATLGAQITQLEQLRLGDDPTITLAAPAGLPLAPYTPKTKLSLAAGLFAGLMLGLAAAFGLHTLDPRLRREEQVRDLLDLPVLAHIPRERSRTQGRPMVPGELSFVALEGYRTLRTLLTSRAAGKPRAFLVTGSSPAEGKTTSAINLAVSLAQGGARVILIDADLRRPTIAATLGLRLKYGTEHVLIGEVGLAQALETVRFERTPVQILAVQRGGVDLANRLSFAVSERLISDAKDLADFVVIDSPPLTEVIDTLPLAKLADDVLIVARLGASRLSKLSELHDLLAEQGTRASGLVLVGEAARPGGYYYTEQDLDAPPVRGNSGSSARAADGVETVRARSD